MRLGYSLGGAQGAHAVAAGVFSGPGHRHVVVPRRSVTRVPLTAMKRGAGYGIFESKSVICQLKHGAGPQAFNLNKHSFAVYSNSQLCPLLLKWTSQIRMASTPGQR